MQRIAIVGCSGGGKSTFARTLGERLDLPVVHLDTLFWKPGWKEGNGDEFCEAVEAVAAQDRWIIEGTFISASTLRFQRADTIIWIEPPMLLCLWRAFRRMLLNFGRVRPDLAPGCPERFDLAFYLFIWRWNRDTRPRLSRALDEFAPGARRVSLVSDAQMAAFVRRND